MGERIGYGRVSTRDQNPDSQHDALTEAGCTKLFVEKVSSKLDERPELEKALAYARAGDTFVITRLARAARNLRELIDLVDTLKARGIDLVVLKQGIDTTTPTGRLVFHVIGAIDEFTRELIVEATHEGLAAARARGRVGGRPAAMTELQIRQARAMYDERGPDDKRRFTVQQIADTFGVGRATIYRHLDPSKPTPEPTSGDAST
jgi:DNA invertase Pin-like site-specific DNA recombinase